MIFVNSGVAKILYFDELKDLMDDPKDLVQVGFLDTFFLFLIYTEVGGVIQSFHDQLSSPGRGQAGGWVLTFQVGSFPRQLKFFLNN